jgi:hypothetical protein
MHTFSSLFLKKEFFFRNDALLNFYAKEIYYNKAIQTFRVTNKKNYMLNTNFN